MSDDSQYRDALIAAAARLHERGVMVSIEGNLSLRLADGNVLTTPSGAVKGHLQPSDLVESDAQGTARSGGRASSELAMHLAIYGARPDVGAIVHAHPTVATGWAVAGRELPVAALAEAVFTFGCVPVAPYATPSTGDLARVTAQALRDYDVALLANHGAVTVGPDIATACERMLQLEHFAQIALVSHLLGGPRALAAEAVADLSSLREQSGASPVPLACYPSTTGSGTIALTREQLMQLIADAVRALR